MKSDTTKLPNSSEVERLSVKQDVAGSTPASAANPQMTKSKWDIAAGPDVTVYTYHCSTHGTRTVPCKCQRFLDLQALMRQGYVTIG